MALPEPQRQEAVQFAVVDYAEEVLVEEEFVIPMCEGAGLVFDAEALEKLLSWVWFEFVMKDGTTEAIWTVVAHLLLLLARSMTVAAVEPDL